MTPKFDNMINETFGDLVIEQGSMGTQFARTGARTAYDPNAGLNWFQRWITKPGVSEFIDRGNIAQDQILGRVNPGRYGPFRGTQAISRANVQAIDAGRLAGATPVTPLSDQLAQWWAGLSPAAKIATGVGAAGAGYLGYKGLTGEEDKDE